MESMKIIMGRTGLVWPAVLSAVRESRASGRRTLLYVPEQMTLQAERGLILGLRLKGLIDTEVISPRKLRMLVRERTGGTSRKALDECGQMMAVHRAMAETGKELAFYRNMTELPGAVRRIREALAELRESDITPEEMENCAERASTGAVQAKIRDLSRIRTAWEALVAEKFEDEKAAWTDLVGRLGRAGLLRGADLLIYGFDTIRPDLRELLQTAWTQAAQVQVFLTADGEDARDAQIFGEQHRSVRKMRESLEEAGGSLQVIRLQGEREGCAPMLQWLDRNLFAEERETFPGTPGKELSLYAAANRGDEAEQVAECLLAWHGEGIPWERMAVALPGGTGMEGMIRAALTLNRIPFSMAGKMPMVSHGVCRMLSAALECAAGGYTTEQVSEAVLSGFTTVTDEEALRLTGYAEAHGIEGNRWRQPFTQGENAADAEQLRQKATGPMEVLRENLRDAKSATESAEALVRFLLAEKVPEKLREREERLLAEGMYREAVADRQVWKKLTELLDQMWTMLGDKHTPVEEVRNMLESALSTAEITTLPETESGVVIGGIGHMLPGDTEALVVPGFQEGMLTAPESGWLQDRERAEMEAFTQREIGMSRERRGWIRRYDYYRTLTAPRRALRISWSLADEKGEPLQEDGLAAAIRSVFPGIRTGGGVAGEHGGGRLPRTPLMALEQAGRMIGEARETGKTDPLLGQAAVSLLYSREYGRTVREMIREARGEHPEAEIRKETAEKLFRTEETSISRLESYAGCPYRHFIDYGLRPVRQEKYEFDSAEAGNFFHAALDRYLRTAGAEAGWPDFTDERVDGIMDTICAELTEEWEGGPLKEDALGIWQGEEYLRRVRHAARVLTRFAANSDFRTIATERSFGRGDGLPPVMLPMADGSRVKLRGIIDRIDTYENGEGLWIRVVDNKSSEKKPDPAKMAGGEQLQLMIYLKAALDAFPGARPAAAMFFPVQDGEVSGGDESPEAIEAERMKKVRMKGLVNVREDVVQAIDREKRPYSMDEVFNKDGSVSKSVKWAVEEETLQGLMQAAEEKAAEICGDIRAGKTPAAPRGDGEDSVCRYCDWKTICHTRPEKKRPREDGITYQEIARRAAAEKHRKNTLREDGK